MHLCAYLLRSKCECKDEFENSVNELRAPFECSLNLDPAIFKPQGEPLQTATTNNVCSHADLADACHSADGTIGVDNGPATLRTTITTIRHGQSIETRQKQNFCSISRRLQVQRKRLQSRNMFAVCPRSALGHAPALTVSARRMHSVHLGLPLFCLDMDGSQSPAYPFRRSPNFQGAHHGPQDSARRPSCCMACSS